MRTFEVNEISSAVKRMNQNFRIAILAILLVTASLLMSAVSDVKQVAQRSAGENSVSDQVCVRWIEKANPNNDRLTILNVADNFPSSLNLTLSDETFNLGPNQTTAQDLSKAKFLRLQSRGVSSQNAVAGHWVRYDATYNRGMAFSFCQNLVSERYFGSIDTSSGNKQTLVLTNPNDLPVVANLRAFTAEGEYPITEFNRVSVAANSVREIDLTQVIPAVSAANLEVKVEQGQLAIGIQARKVAADKSRGLSFNSGVALPSTEVLIVGAINGSELDRLQVFAADEDAIVSVSVVTQTGIQALAEFDATLVPAGTVKEIEITNVIGANAAALLIKSDTPVVATLSQLASSGSDIDLEILNAQSPVTPRTAIPLLNREFELRVFGYAKTTSTVTVSAWLNGEQMWSEVLNFNAGTFAPFKLSNKLPLGGSLHFAVEGEVAITQWVRRNIKNSEISTAVQLKNLSADVTPSVRLEMLQP